MILIEKAKSEIIINQIINSLSGRLWNYSLRDVSVDFGPMINVLGVPNKQFFISYIENRFQNGMTWDNYGRGRNKWVVDHIIPISYYDLRGSKEECYICFNYNNLQPLWAKDNLKKKDKLPNGISVLNMLKSGMHLRDKKDWSLAYLDYCNWFYQI